MPGRERRAPRAPSLRGRLLAAMTLGFALLALPLSALLWNYAREAANRTHDLLLAGSALAMLERVSSGAGGPTVDIPYSALSILGLAPDDRVFYGVTALGPSGAAAITGAEDLPLPEGYEPAAAPVFYDARHGGERARFAAQARRITDGGAPVWVLVRVGQTTRARDAQAISLFALGAGGLGLVSLLGLGAVWLAIRGALRPLAAVGRDIRGRAPSDLSPVAGDPPREVRDLVGSIDGFMERLDLSRRRTEGFIADVAHQTRTSLAALRGQLALAGDARDEGELRERVRRAERQAERTVRLTNQLLSHAMVIHRAEGGAVAPVDLRDLARALLAEMLRDTALRRVDLAFEADGPGAAVRGDAISIREALRNLVENAVRHGPPDNRIAVRVRTEPETVELEVADQGPGIPAADRAAAMERFRSLDPDAGGSGLGLAIVKAVADTHGAALLLEDAPPPGGLSARLRFPRAAAALLALALTLPGGGAGAGDLAVWSATDTAAFAPVIAAFERASPGDRILHREFDTADLHRAVLEAGVDLPDVVISSAMDLQVDLVNRGLARPLPRAGAGLPDWAAWRSELFGFTFEPVAMVYRAAEFDPGRLPATHGELAAMLREREAELRGRVATYDVTRSGVGYLFATQDAVQGAQSQRLAEAMGRAGARTFCCTSRMTDGVARGELSLAVNVIGSYALAAAREDPRIGVHFFRDYNLVMARTAFVPRAAADPEGGARFVAFLLSPEGQRAIARTSSLLPIDAAARTADASGPTLEGAGRSFLPIRLAPSLLTYLDGLKRRRFLEDWSSVMSRPGPG